MNKIEDKKCAQYYKDSECTKNPDWMLANCGYECWECKEDKAEYIKYVFLEDETNNADKIELDRQSLMYCLRLTENICSPLVFLCCSTI